MLLYIFSICIHYFEINVCNSVTNQITQEVYYHLKGFENYFAANDENGVSIYY